MTSHFSPEELQAMEPCLIHEVCLREAADPILFDPYGNPYRALNPRQFLKKNRKGGGKQNPLPKEQREQIKKMRAAGLTVNFISDALGVSRCSVTKYKNG